MVLEQARENLLKESQKRTEEAKKEKSITDQVKLGFKMAETFYKAENYSNAYFMYYKTFQKLAKQTAMKKLKMTDITEEEATNYLINKDKITKKDMEEFKKTITSIVEGKEISKKQCSNIKKAITELKNEQGTTNNTE